MVTLAQRIESLRTEIGVSRTELSAALGFPKAAFEKFETGRQTPSKEQQDKIAAYFGVSLFYLRGESNDRTRLEDWIDAAGDEQEHVPMPAPAPRRPKADTAAQGTLLDTVLASKQTQELLRTIVLDTLKSSEGQEIIAKIVRRELARQG